MNFHLITLGLARYFVVIVTNVLTSLVIMTSLFDAGNPLMTTEVVLLSLSRKRLIIKFAKTCLFSCPMFMNHYLWK